MLMLVIIFYTVSDFINKGFVVHYPTLCTKTQSRAMKNFHQHNILSGED